MSAYRDQADGTLVEPRTPAEPRPHTFGDDAADFINALFSASIMGGGTAIEVRIEAKRFNSLLVGLRMQGLVRDDDYEPWRTRRLTLSTAFGPITFREFCASEACGV